VPFAAGNFLYIGASDLVPEVNTDPESNVFHKAIAFDGGILTLGGSAAAIKLWRAGEDGAYSAETIWTRDFGGRFSRMRDAEIADIDGDGQLDIAVATHDQGVVAIVKRGADGSWTAEEIDQEPDTFVHEIEIGDLDGDGVLEVYATPSEPNRLDGTPQHGSVVRYVPAKGEGRTEVADLGDRHAKEILVADVDGDGRDELYVVVEAVSGGRVEIRRYDADTPPDAGAVIAELDDTQTRFLSVGDVDGDGRREMVAAGMRSGLWLLRPGPAPARTAWAKTLIDASSGGFEHASILADLDGDGRDELYVASDNQGEVRRYDDAALRVADGLGQLRHRRQPGQAQHLRLPGPRLRDLHARPRDGPPEPAEFLWGLVPTRKPKVESTRGGTSFWVHAGRDGIRSVVLTVPVTFPVEGVHHSDLLAGFPLPDIRGTVGTFSYWATDLSPAEAGNTEFGGILERLLFEDGVASTVLVGPDDPLVAKGEPRRRLTVPLGVRWTEGASRVDLDLAGQEARLAPGEWSDWIPVTFRVNPLVRVRGMVQLHVVRADRELQGLRLPGQPRPSAARPPDLEPGGLRPAAGGRGGPLPDPRLGGGDLAPQRGAARRGGLHGRLRPGLRRPRADLHEEPGAGRLDLYLAVVETTDRVQHMMWRFIADPTSIILESISDGVFTVDRHWRITSFNRAAEEITGIPRTEAVGRRCSEVFRASMCEADCALRRTLETGEPVINRRPSSSTRTAAHPDQRVHGPAARGGRAGARRGGDLPRPEPGGGAAPGAGRRFQMGDLVSRSPAMRRIFDILPQVAASDSTVLIQGETGTGKELLARALHDLSPRRKRPFVAVSCGALPDTLLESELFGYKAGAFTGANRDKPGRFALAEGGTLFLDEIGDMSPALQVRLLRVLQERTYEPLGGTKPLRADVRVVAATHRDLAALVRRGVFRQDLYYRINVMKLDSRP
jgi:PAS domain-containing protein